MTGSCCPITLDYTLMLNRVFSLVRHHRMRIRKHFFTRVLTAAWQTYDVLQQLFENVAFIFKAEHIAQKQDSQALAERMVHRPFIYCF